MLLLVGLGNPGSQYVRNRHNIGFMAVEAIARRHNFSPWKRRFQGVTAEGTIAGTRALLLLPGTYMNESGRAVQEASAFYKIELNDIVVFQDEVELPPAKLRMKTGGGNAGHNGLRSITAHMGNDYRRVRLGVGHPGSKELMHNHVLSDFSRADNEWLEALCDAIAGNVELIAKGQDATFQNKIHLAMAAKGFDSKGEGDKPGAGK
jgi:PTH1 family peptidyl-tRNA hydrolase